MLPLRRLRPLVSRNRPACCKHAPLSPSSTTTAPALSSTTRRAAPFSSSSGINAIKNRNPLLQFIYNQCRKLVPRLSPTERAALDAGTVGFDRNIFTGSPKLSDLAKYIPLANLSDAEQSFVDNEVGDLCEILDDYKIANDRELPQEFWDRCKSQGFFGLIIPKEFGGKGFSG